MIKKCLLVAVTIASGIASGAWAQSTPQPVQMILLRVEKSQGHDYIISPKGFKAEIPGKGISANAQNVAVYQDGQGNYWYIDKHGQPTQVKPEVFRSVMAQFQADAARQGMAGGMQPPGGMMPPGGEQMPMNGMANGMAPGMVPGMAPGMVSTMPPTQQTTIVQQPANSGSGGVGSAAGIAGMAMGGTALGMSIGALANSNNNYGYAGYHGMPYGHPMYNEGNRYYYNDANGHKAYVNQNNYNKAYLNQFNKQGTWDNRQQWQKNVQGINPATRETLENRGAQGGRRFENRGGFRRRF